MCYHILRSLEKQKCSMKSSITFNHYKLSFSMKLATVNPRQYFDMNSQIRKDMCQSNRNLSQQLYPIESSTSEFYQQNPQQVLFVGSIVYYNHSAVDPLPPVHPFVETFSQFAGFEGGDLHSFVKLGYGDQTSEMKFEL